MFLKYLLFSMLLIPPELHLSREMLVHRRLLPKPLKMLSKAAVKVAVIDAV